MSSKLKGIASIVMLFAGARLKQQDIDWGNMHD
jgi:hypothetical protein